VALWLIILPDALSRRRFGDSDSVVSMLAGPAVMGAARASAVSGRLLHENPKIGYILTHQYCTMHDEIMTCERAATEQQREQGAEQAMSEQ
jgi:hypothetical protein